MVFEVNELIERDLLEMYNRLNNSVAILHDNKILNIHGLIDKLDFPWGIQTDPCGKNIRYIQFDTRNEEYEIMDPADYMLSIGGSFTNIEYEPALIVINGGKKDLEKICERDIKLNMQKIIHKQNDSFNYGKSFHNKINPLLTIQEILRERKDIFSCLTWEGYTKTIIDKLKETELEEYLQKQKEEKKLKRQDNLFNRTRRNILTYFQPDH
ncbi:hypothetical protein HOD29_06255 [archaeon]|jgi:hypothetical protein|nr:hypothetical protein [archaeon]